MTNRREVLHGASLFLLASTVIAPVGLTIGRQLPTNTPLAKRDARARDPVNPLRPGRGQRTPLSVAAQRAIRDWRAPRMNGYGRREAGVISGNGRREVGIR